MRIGFLILAIALAALAILAFQYGGKWFAEPPPEAAAPVAVPKQAAAAQSPAPEPVAVEPAAPAIVLPELDSSDVWAVERLAGLGVPAQWLDREGLVRRLAVLIDNAPRGEYPRRQLGFLAPTGAFKVFKLGDEIFLDPASYARYDGYLDLLESIDPQSLADTLVMLEPLITQGLAELGNQRPMAAQISTAIDDIAALQGLGDEVRLVQPRVLYEFADPQLEALSPLLKQALRLGPDNLGRLQSYLRRFQQALLVPQEPG